MIGVLFSLHLIGSTLAHIKAYAAKPSCEAALSMFEDRHSLPTIAWKLWLYYRDPLFEVERRTSGLNAASWISEVYHKVVTSGGWSFKSRDNSPTMRLLTMGTTHTKQGRRVLVAGESHFRDRLEIWRLGNGPVFEGFVFLKQEGLQFRKLFQDSTGKKMGFEVLSGDRIERFEMDLESFQVRVFEGAEFSPSVWHRMRAKSYFFFQDENGNVALHAHIDPD